MIKGAEDSERIAEFYEYIEDGEVKEAFALLLGSFTCYKKVSCRVSAQKKVRSIAVDYKGKWCFSIMASKQKLVFHWRPHILNMGLCKKAPIKANFGDRFTDKSHKEDDEHWAVTLKNIQDALILLLILQLS
ncbi:hypothetical protein [Pseudomonas abietaniphila]